MATSVQLWPFSFAAAVAAAAPAAAARAAAAADASVSVGPAWVDFCGGEQEANDWGCSGLS